MRITWITRSFLDYRIPIYKEIDTLCENNLTVIYASNVVPDRCGEKIINVLGGRAIGLDGELRIGGEKKQTQSFANTGGLRITLVPGLINKIKKTKPDIIISDGFFGWTYAALVNNAIWKTPHLMLYERTLHTERNVSSLRILARKIASKFISAYSCNGEQTKEYLQEFGIPESKLFMGNMAADTDGLQKAIKNVMPSDIEALKTKFSISGKLFLCLSQLIPRKGILEMFKSWQHFEKINSNATLVILGDGELKKDLERYLNENSLKQVMLLNKVDYSEVAQFYAAADIFIIPTLEDNWSLVVPEAMSCELPVLCSKYNGCWPELVRKENGWVFDPLDEKNFSETIKDAWKKQEQWSIMGKKSFKIVQNYTPEKIAQKIFNSINKVLGYEL